MNYLSSLICSFLYASTAAIWCVTFPRYPTIFDYLFTLMRARQRQRQREIKLMNSRSSFKCLLLLRKLCFLNWHPVRERIVSKWATQTSRWPSGHKSHQTFTVTLKRPFSWCLGLTGDVSPSGGPSLEDLSLTASPPEEVFISLSSICKCPPVSDIGHVLCLGG